jgi:nucleoside-diphosphate-sugar epimerase
MAVVLVTGANGFVGINVVRRLAQNGADVVALARRAPDRETHAFLGPCTDRVRWIQGDIRDPEPLKAAAGEYGVDHVLHSAAITPTRAMERQAPRRILDVNLGGTLNALEVARSAGARRFVLVSSSGLYGAPPAPLQPLTEAVPPVTGSLYTICKAASEALCRRYQDLHGLSAVAARLGTTYGPMERASQSREHLSQIYILAHRALAGEVAAVYGAERLRDFCYADDMAEAIAGLVLAADLAYDLYNVATEQTLSLRDVLDTLARLCPAFRWAEVARPDEADVALLPENQRVPLDMSRLRDELGFTPAYDLEAGLRRYLDWLRAGGASR